MAEQADAFDAGALIDGAPIGAFQCMVCALGALVLFVDGFDTQAIGFVGPQLARLWHIPHDMLGYLFSSALVGLMIGYLVIAPLSGRFGARRVVIACVASFGVLSILATTAHGIAGLMVYRLLTGIGLGGAIPAAVALTGEYAPLRWRSSFITWMYCGLTLGQIAAGLVSIAVLQRYGWRGVLWVGGALPLLHAALMAAILPESLEFMVRSQAPRGRILAVLGRVRRGVAVPAGAAIVAGARASQGTSVTRLFDAGRGYGTIAIWIALFMNLLVFFFFGNWLPTILTEAGYSARGAISGTAIALGGGLLAAAVLGPLMDRLGPYRVLTVLFLGGALFIALIGASEATTSAILVATAFCAGFCISGIQKCVNALAIFFYPVSVRSTGLGWGLGVGRIGAIIGPSATGLLLVAGWSTASVFYAAAVPMLIGAAAMAAMGRRYRGGTADAPRAAAAVVRSLATAGGPGSAA